MILMILMIMIVVVVVVVLVDDNGMMKFKFTWLFFVDENNIELST